MKAAASWAEQRYHNEMALQAVELSVDPQPHPLVTRYNLRERVEALSNIQQPDLSKAGANALGLSSITRSQWNQSFRLTNQATIKIDPTTGALIGLQSNRVSAPEWASASSPLGAFIYQTLNDSDWKPFTYDYINGHGMSSGFCKPGSNNYSESKHWFSTLTNVFVDDPTCLSGNSLGGTCDTVLLELQMPDRAIKTYGCPSLVYTNITARSTMAQNARSAQGDTASLRIELTYFNKSPTMVGESLMFTFKPAIAFPAEKAWAMDKLGSWVDPEDVIAGGNQMNHGVWGGVKVSTLHGKQMTIVSLDAPNMCPMTADYPYGNPLPAGSDGMLPLQKGSVFGMGANLHNNLWNTNYPLYYPFYDAAYCKDPLNCSNKNSKFRFELSFD